MPICIECRYPVAQLYHVLHSNNHKTPRIPPPPPSHIPSAGPTATAATGAPSKSNVTTSGAGASGKRLAGTSGGGGGKGVASGGDVRLMQCPRCRRFADKYVEHDFVVLFIDLVLVKPQVYRHLLFNRLGRDDDELDPSITRLGVLLLLFDVYLTWSRIESLPPHLTAHSPIPPLPILLQYAFYLLLSILTTIAQHLTIRYLAAQFLVPASNQPITSSPSSPLPPPPPSPPPTTQPPPNPPLTPTPTPTPTTTTTPTPPTPSSISTALFVSSCMKLFPLLMIVWRYDDPGRSLARGVDWAVAVQNLEALRILLGCGYVAAAGLVAAGWLAGAGLRGVVLGGVGLGEESGF